MYDTSLRNNLLEFLTKGPAHITCNSALSGIKPEIRNIKPEKGVHSIWEELEHMRIAQEDIIKYTLDESWNSPPWPEGYWPEEGIQLNEDMWQSTIKRFTSDLAQVVEIVKNTAIDLNEKIPHGQGHTYLREILMIIDHNAYHLGQIVLIRKLLGDWHN